MSGTCAGRAIVHNIFMREVLALGEAQLVAMPSGAEKAGLATIGDNNQRLLGYSLHS